MMQPQDTPQPLDRNRLEAEVLPYPASQGRADIVHEDDRVVIGFHLPELRPDDLRHRVEGPSLLVWSGRPDVPYKCLLPLPDAADATAYLVTMRNGVIEFVFARQGAAS